MGAKDFGYLDNPANGLDIIRARTLIGNLRLWDIPRKQEAIDIVVHEIGSSPLPTLYLLFSDKKVYIGQTENLKNRLDSHIKNPEDKIKNWGRAIIINDARNAPNSDMNDENIRLSLENFLVRLFKINRYTVVTSAIRTPGLSATQKILVDSFREELTVLLTRKSKISKILTEKGDDEIYNDEVLKLLKKKNYNVEKWGKLEAVINGEQIFIRPGSNKSKGWQITFRGNKPDSLKTSLQKKIGKLLVPRGPVLLIPLIEISNFISDNDSKAFNRDTIDIFIHFDESEISIVYKNDELNVSYYAINKY